jgi:hypothetical protein
VIASGIDHRSPPYAGLARRLVAAAIDLALAWAAYSIAITAFDPGIASDYPTTLEAALVAVIVLAVAGLWLGYLVLAQSLWGQTLGMRFLGMEVVEGPGGRPSWGRALVRTVSLAVDLVVGPLLIAVSKRRQRLGDRLANTVVVMKRDEASEPAGAGALETKTPSVPPPTAGGAPPLGTPPEPTSGHVAATWGPGRVGVGILVLLVLSVVEVAIVSIFDPSLDSLAARLAAQALLAATLVGVAFGVGGDTLRGASAGVAMGLRKPLRSPWGRAAAAYLAYVVFAVAYSSLVHPEQKDITRDLGVGQGDLGVIAAGILIIGAAPISEEIFFRGFIYGGFRRRLSFPAAALLSALIFGLFHYTGSGSLAVVPQLAVLGFAFCWVYEETGSIYPTISLHMLNNAFAFAVLAS